MTTEHDQPAGGAERTAAPPINFEDLQEGDTVMILAKISRQPVGDIVAVALHGASKFADVWVHVDSIATHTPKPRPLAPGDKAFVLEPAWSTHAGVPGPRAKIIVNIIAIKGGLAWVEGDATPQPSYLVSLEDLERAL